MLCSSGSGTSADVAVERYLHDLLGTTPSVSGWPQVRGLPYFLQDAFELRQLTLFNRHFLMAVDKHPATRSLANIRVQLDKLGELTGHAVVYVTGAVASYERKRLIEQHIPFIVPGNQLYLPDLGIDLREYFRQRPAAPGAAFSPATQAALLALLPQKPWRAEWQVSELVGQLGYSAMTLTRVVRELSDAGVTAVRVAGRSRWVCFHDTAAQVWEGSQSLLRSPVKRKLWARPLPAWQPQQARLAGLSALARLTMIAEPQVLVYAVTAAEWKAATAAGIRPMPEPFPGACEWEIWSYAPAQSPGSETVDVLSLALSLRENTDERVQLALDELKEHFPW